MHAHARYTVFFRLCFFFFSFLLFSRCGDEQGTLVCRCAGVATPAKPVWDFEKKKKKKKRKRRFFEFFSEFYLLIQGYNHICSGFLCACDPTIKTNRSVQSKEIDVRNSHKKVAYRAPAAQLKMTSGSPQLYPMP